MTIADDIITRRMPNFDYYLQKGETLDDMDQYGFTPLIETAITNQPDIARELLKRGADINKPDIGGRTALQWACDQEFTELVKLLLEHGADPNTYTRAGISALVYPILRQENTIKRLLYQYGAKVDFALDFITAKLIGHRYELSGDVDIVNGKGEFIEVDYEGFILEFTIAIILDSLRRFTSSFATRQLRNYFPSFFKVMDGFTIADQLLRLQRAKTQLGDYQKPLNQLIQEPLIILPAASKGHAIGFVRYLNYWAKIDRGENSKKEGSINLYKINNPQAFDANFLKKFLFEKQPREFFHQSINQILSLEQIGQIPMTSQISGNCSWANMQAIVPAAFTLDHLAHGHNHQEELALFLYDEWIEWDKERALEDCIQRFYQAEPKRKASFASMLAAVLFQSCDYHDLTHIKRAEKILPILMLPEYGYILNSYLETYCIKRLTQKGNNLLKILEECGVNPNIGVNPIATPLPTRSKS